MKVAIYSTAFKLHYKKSKIPQNKQFKEINQGRLDHIRPFFKEIE